jgi:hypothetical protein
MHVEPFPYTKTCKTEINLVTNGHLLQTVRELHKNVFHNTILE